MKRPAFQFYPADWRKDVELRSCSIAARGLWIDILCIAHECDPYGHLAINGRPMTAAKLAGQVGLTAAQCKTLLDELIENGVARIDGEGVIYSKRMVQDEDVRNRRADGGKAGSEHGKKGAEHGIKGGRPRKEKGDLKTPLKTHLGVYEEPPPSSSSSSSNTPIPPDTGGLTADAFEQFWRAYPKKVGKDAAQKAFARRKPDKPTLEAMLAAVSVQAASEQWRRDGGQFVPNPATWLNQGRWKDGESAAEPAVLEGFV